MLVVVSIASSISITGGWRGTPMVLSSMSLVPGLMVRVLVAGVSVACAGETNGPEISAVASTRATETQRRSDPSANPKKGVPLVRMALLVVLACSFIVVLRCRCLSWAHSCVSTRLWEWNCATTLGT